MEEKVPITTSLAMIQRELKVPKGQRNDFGKYDYRNLEDILEAVKPLLKATGLVLTLDDEIVAIGSRIYVKCTATIDNGTAQYFTRAYAREPEAKKGMDESQITGTASSYARKKALGGLFLIDDTKDADSMDNSSEEKPKGLNVNAEKKRFWNACMTACGGDKAEATKLSEKMLAALGHGATAEDYKSLAFAVESGAR